VFAFQWEFGCVVVEVGFSPTEFFVTGRAVFSQDPVMDIVLGVTVNALLGSFAVAFCVFVAGGTGDFGVSTPELEIGIAVFEGLAIEAENVAVSPQVFAVAVTAACIFHARVTPM